MADTVAGTKRLNIVRRNTKEGIHPREMIEWEYRDVIIEDLSTGKEVFRQDAVEVPVHWSDRAVKVVVQKYFYGKNGTDERESSIHQLIERVTKTFADWGLKSGYFADEKEAEAYQHELYYIIVHQKAAWNSPVWFNAGIEDRQPQMHACHIMSVKDTLHGPGSIMQQVVDEAYIFSLGSGIGTNVGALRSSYEHIKGGGKASGPISFMKMYDSAAGVVQSGGKTRRAAVMRTINDTHPDVYHGKQTDINKQGKDFVTIKAHAEKMAHVLVDAGYGGSMNCPAYESVPMQNANLSVRASDEFMQAVKAGEIWATKYVHDRAGEVCNEFPAEEMMEEICKGTWVCGDPGLQFDSTIQRWHTCKEDGRIESSNPCSEYLFLDDTSCNLCSMNLMKYWTLEKGFDVDSFEHDVSLMFIACDIINDHAWLANDELAKGVRNYRTIGLGYCNLGALILSHGLSYDSHRARVLMGTITSLMTAICYKTSTELAEHLEPFPRFGRNRDSFIDVMKQHSMSHYKLEKTEGYEEVHQRAARLWDLVVDRSQKYGARNAQATVLAPTGTISFMMDSDTTGCEPVLSHVTYKNLDGGGTIMIALNTFKNALKAMGYKGEEYDAIVKHMEAYGTLETVKLPKDCATVAEFDAKMATDDYVCPPEKQWTERACPFLKPDELKVFDTSFPARLGKRSIHHNGHILALAAVQPFISGGMSKTINMPESASVQDIKAAYMLAWEKGVKCVAIYRDNCKRIQPATTKKAFSEEKKFDRAELPDEPLPADRHKFRVGDLKGYIHVTCYPNTNTPAEIFIKAAKQGELISTMLDIIGQLISYHLQVPGKANTHLKQVTKILIGTHSKPSGFTGKSWCKQATSIFDYIGKMLQHHYDVEDDLDAVQQAFVEEAQHRGLKVNDAVSYTSVKDCPMCSTPMRYLGGTCHQCPSCTYSDGGCSA